MGVHADQVQGLLAAYAVQEPLQVAVADAKLGAGQACGHVRMHLSTRQSSHWPPSQASMERVLLRTADERTGKGECSLLGQRSAGHSHWPVQIVLPCAGTQAQAQALEQHICCLPEGPHQG